MPSNDRRPSLEASPLSEPSAWQRRFGRKPATNQQHDREPRAHDATSSRLRSSPPPRPATASIADQLLQSLADRERAGRPEHELSRECAEQLLGKRNAFATDLRMDEKVSAELAQQRRNDDVSALAKKIIRNRMQVENQAEALRRGCKDRSRTGSAQPASRPALSSAERLRQLRGAQTRREREHKAKATNMSRAQQPQPTRATLVQSDEASGDPEDRNEDPNNKTSPSFSHPQTRRARPMTSQRVRTAETRTAPPQPNPIAQMEQRQAKIREMREARRLQPKHTATSREASSPTPSQGDESGRSAVKSEEKQLQERITRLTAENQHAVELAERVRAQKRQWEAKSAVFAAWKRLLLARQDCAAHALAVFRWRTLRRLMTSWRDYCVACRRERIANESRESCVREQSLLTRADAFLRKKQLPRWFYRWAASVVAAKERRRAEEAAQRRRQQAQRLMERLVRGPEQDSLGNDEVEDDAQPPCCQSPTPDHHQPKATSRQHTGATTSSRSPSRSVMTDSRGRHARASAPRSREADPPVTAQGALTSQSSVSSAPPPPPTTSRTAASTATPPRTTAAAPVDPIYASMLERADERKERREVLRLKYERAQQEKRETLAM